VSTGKGPSRVTDGPYANWGVDDEQGQIALAAGATIKIGQPLALDVTQFGPDNNVPNNGAALPLCERLVAVTSANAGDLFGVVTVVNPGSVAPTKFPLTYVNGVPTYTNLTGSTFTVLVTVCQLGWAYVWAGTARTGATTNVTVGCQLVTNSTNAFAIAGSAAIGSTVGQALATAVNTTESYIASGLNVPAGSAGAAMGPGVVSIVPNSLQSITPNLIVLIDSLASGVQESVSVGSISYPTFSVALTNAHAGGFRITDTRTSAANASLLISVPGAGVSETALVAAYVNIQA
jgi:hypothetical protein